jgi:cytochrome c oxidase cbb3-type subunit 2
VVKIPGPRAPKDVAVVAKPEAIALVDYLISLNRTYPVESDTAHAAGGAVAHAMPGASRPERRP